MFRFGNDTSIVAHRGDKEYLLTKGSLRAPEQFFDKCGID